jgi:murein DD-endopeptidase MepM/ murein hydrolase activator NlpD
MSVAPPTDDSSSRIAVPPPAAADTDLEVELDAQWFDEIKTPLPAPAPSLSATPAVGTQALRDAPSLTATPAMGVRTISCPACAGPVDVKSPHVAVYGGAVRVYCSAACLEARDPIVVEEPTVPPKRRTIWWGVFAGFLVAGGAAAFFLQRELREMHELTPPAPALDTTHAVADPEPKAANDPQKEADTALVAELMQDAWVHPLAGPTRRMPRAHTGAFGAERPGDRPPECVSGHCGVDVGNVWGERIYAVHDGVIDFVNRGPNEERGGVFVRISHRDGTLFSWYFHLAAVPRHIRPGLKVSAGTMIGLLGDTGVKHSEPHLHFSLSVKTSKHQRERYLDPEPLIAIWPLWIPNESGGGTVSTAEEPGLPMRAAGGGKRKPRDAKPPESANETAAASPMPASSPPPEAAASPPPPSVAPAGTGN